MRRDSVVYNIYYIYIVGGGEPNTQHKKTTKQLQVGGAGDYGWGVVVVDGGAGAGGSAGT